MPKAKIILCEPLLLEGPATTGEKYPEFLKIREYAAVVKKLSQEFNLPFVALQDKSDCYDC